MLCTLHMISHHHPWRMCATCLVDRGKTSFCKPLLITILFPRLYSLNQQFKKVNLHTPVASSFLAPHPPPFFPSIFGTPRMFLTGCSWSLWWIFCLSKSNATFGLVFGALSLTLLPITYHIVCWIILFIFHMLSRFSIFMDLFVCLCIFSVMSYKGIFYLLLYLLVYFMWFYFLFIYF